MAISSKGNPVPTNPPWTSTSRGCSHGGQACEPEGPDLLPARDQDQDRQAEVFLLDEGGGSTRRIDPRGSRGLREPRCPGLPAEEAAQVHHRRGDRRGT